MRKLTAKRKKFLSELLSNSFMLTAMDYFYAEDNETEFIKEYGLSFEEAEEAHKALIDFLDKPNGK